MIAVDYEKLADLFREMVEDDAAGESWEARSAAFRTALDEDSLLSEFISWYEGIEL